MCPRQEALRAMFFRVYWSCPSWCQAEQKRNGAMGCHQSRSTTPRELTKWRDLVWVPICNSMGMILSGDSSCSILEQSFTPISLSWCFSITWSHWQRFSIIFKFKSTPIQHPIRNGQTQYTQKSESPKQISWFRLIWCHIPVSVSRIPQPMRDGQPVKARHPHQAVAQTGSVRHQDPLQGAGAADLWLPGRTNLIIFTTLKNGDDSPYRQFTLMTMI